MGKKLEGLFNLNREEQTLWLEDERATFSLGRQLGKTLPPNTVVLLKGTLGAGKTTLIQGIGEGLGITEPILSPTFNLINEYTQGRIPLYHFDLYRLSMEQIRSLYPEIYWEGIEVEPGICAIEWAQRLPYQPERYLEIDLEIDLHKGRKAIIRNHLTGNNLARERGTKI